VAEPGRFTTAILKRTPGAVKFRESSGNARGLPNDYYDGVYTTLLANGEVILDNFNSEPRTDNVGGTTVILPPKSLRSALLKPANPPRKQVRV